MRVVISEFISLDGIVQVMGLCHHHDDRSADVQTPAEVTEGRSSQAAVRAATTGCVTKRGDAA